MLNKYASEFFEIGQRLKAIQVLLLIMKGEDIHSIGFGLDSDAERAPHKQLQKLCDICKRIGLDASSKKGQEMYLYFVDNIQQIATPKELPMPEFERFIKKLDKDFSVLQELLISELGNNLFFHVHGSYEIYYLKNQFSQAVQNELVSSMFDMEEAGKCYALQRFPACVFHLMRIVDACLKRIASEYQIQVRNSNWEEYLRPIKDEADKFRKTEPERAQLLYDVAQAISAIKPMRNQLSHSDELLPLDSIHRIETKYTPEEADRCFKNVKVLTESVIKVFPN